MSSGLWTMMLAFIIIGILTAWGVKQTKRNIQKGKRYTTGSILFFAGVALGIGFIIFARSMTNLDLILFWLILAMGCMAAASIALLIGFYSEKSGK
ncbi:ABC-type spermidine/putrescine transport system permease subunit II [Bacillus thermophilus]|uniref:ABC-type spermidine/putrescine transport system permease subunit II n=1 Tax=Siminovitchia thermophila TaxID=1245522 RepID=A0ABS2R1A5_9BACI|nr:hypothetical protein [Siminovitchia thermophila]MBM7713354.1 ABC-type spermidine/putrescine transport system permease subunit II [Siminovitchia thermophila]ONK24622.1 hypothetical protein BLX87_04455 [Bacillus sp. VT-16-64]